MPSILLFAPVTEPNVTNAQHGSPPVPQPNTGSWRLSMGASFLVLSALTYILARVVFLPYFMGLFFYQVAGLIAGSAGFRVARPVRPVRRARLIGGALLVALSAWCVSIVFEYYDRVDGIAREGEFYEAKLAAVERGESAADVMARVQSSLRDHFRTQYPPGGVVGYVRWVVQSGEQTLTVDGVTDTVRIAHRQRAWVLRSIASIALMATGLFMAFQALVSPTPVSNLLVPGEEAEDDE